MIPSSSLSPAKNRRSEGFSLVEVVMAVAIAALGIITVMGLIPHGLELSRKTGNEIAIQRITSQIVAEMQAASWADLPGTGGRGRNRAFDDQGLELVNAGDAGLRTAYVVSVTVPPPDVGLPSNSQGSSVNNYLRRVVIDVAVSNDEAFRFDDSLPRRYTRTSHLISQYN